MVDGESARPSDRFAVNSYEVIELPREGVGQGGISLHRRIESGEIAENDVNQMQDAVVAGEYLTPVMRFEVVKCGDGRLSLRPTAQGTQAFGGTAGIAKSLRLAGALGEQPTAGEDIGGFVRERHTRGLQSGGHRAEAHGGGCGCGECDGASAAMALIDGNETIEGLTHGLYQSLNVAERTNLDDSEFAAIYAQVAQSATSLLGNGYFDDGPAQIDAIDQAEPEVENIEDLDGEHKEVLWVINLIEGSTLDRERLVEDFADRNINVFWEDQWAIEREFAEFTEDESQLHAAIVADLMRRVATAANLTAGDLRIIILR